MHLPSQREGYEQFSEQPVEHIRRPLIYIIGRHFETGLHPPFALFCRAAVSHDR